MTLSHWRPTGGPFDHPRMATVDLRCYHCGDTTRVPVKQLHDREATYWRERYEKLMGQLNDAIVLCHKKHGTDPMTQDMQEELERIRDRLDNPWKDQ